MTVRALADKLTMLCNECAAGNCEVLLSFEHDFGSDRSRIGSVGIHGSTVYIHAVPDKEGFDA